MSGNNPYAVNGNSTNPYGSSNPYGGSGRYTDPYSSQNNASSASVNSFGSRGDRRRGSDRPSTNPYEQPSARRPSPGPPSASYDSASRRGESPDPGRTQVDPRFGRGPRPSGGGYGGPGATSNGQDSDRYRQQQQTPTRPRTATREPSGDRSRDRDRDRERTYSNSNSRSRERKNPPTTRDIPPPPTIPAANGGYGANRHYSPRRPAKSMDEILKHIQSQWQNMEGDECIPVKVALQLMDPSSVGLGNKEADFSDTHVDLQRSLKKVVNEHYDDFNSAVGTYHKIQNSIRESQSRVRYLKNGLISVKGSMLTTRPELRGLAEQSGELDGLLLVLVQMEALREMPGRLEELVSEKRWIGAVELLGEALRSCRKSELDGIGAMSDLRGYFTSQETSLLDVLVEELHDHLYLKSPYCQDRWKGEKLDGGNKDARETFGGNTWDRPVYQFLSTLDARKPMSEDASKEPEAETFRYIHMIVEALNKLGYLEETITRIEQRMPIELYKVVDKTNNEIDLKYPLHLRAQLDKDARSMRIVQLSEAKSQVLSDFLWTLYAKFEAIAEGHRVLHEVVLGITEREKLSKPERYTSGFKELWKLYQMEIRSLLHDYLAAGSNTSLGRDGTVTTTSDVFSKRQRDKNRKLFKLSEVDQKSADLKAEEEELDQILKSSVPGLVSKSKTRNKTGGKHDRDAPDGTAAGHKLLIEPTVFNMTVLLPPSLTFLQHLKDIVPQTSKIAMSTLTSFLDDFLINVFHPQLEEAVTELCAQSMMDIEAFTEDSQWSKHSPHPILKGSVSFMTLVQAFSSMLSSIPQDQMFTRLIIDQLMTYYDKCYSFYKAMVSRVATTTPENAGTSTITWKPAAAHAESGDIHDVLTELWKPNVDPSKRVELTGKIVQLLFTTVKASPVQAYDIISDPKSVHQLALLYNSMQWLSSSLARLRFVESATKSFKAHSRNVSQSSYINPRRWTLIKSLKTSSEESKDHLSQPTYLPLNAETVVPFDTTLQSMRALAERALMTLYLDIRFGVIHQLGRALRPAGDSVGEITSSGTDNKTSPAIDSGLYPFILPSPPTSASPRILELNNDLINFDANISTHLGPKECKFIIAGLGRLVDKYLVAGADYIQIMNREGAERMRVDAMVIQQVLRGLGVETTASARQRFLLTDRAGDVTASSIGLGIQAANGTTPSYSTTTTTGTERDDDDGAILTMSSRFYDLFLAGPDAIMKYVRGRKEATPPQDVGYTYDELRTLIELCFSATLRGNDREEALKARKKLNDLLLHLGEIMWDS